MNLTNVEKKKNLLVLSFEDNRTATFDFIDGTYTGIRGTQVTDKTFIGYLKNHTDLNENLLFLILMGAKDSQWERRLANTLMRIESWLSYMDLLDLSYLERPWQASSYLATLLRIGVNGNYIKWLRKNNLKVNDKTYKDYNCDRIALSVGKNKEDNKIVKLLIECFGFYPNIFSNFTIELQKKLIKSLKVDFKNYEYPCQHRTLKDMLTTYPHLEKYYDDNRGLDYNCKMLKNILDAEKEKIIIEKEQVIYPLENLDLGDLQIVVPHSLADFTDEGNQQHNCVGNYYHDSIAQGRNLIYFIRKKENPSKSYITCRFNIDSNQTIEYRTINNQYVSTGMLPPTTLAEIDFAIRGLIK